MDKKKFIFGFAFMLVITGLVFVFAALDAPDDLIFEDNTTTNFDKEGVFTVNWTAVTNADNYTIFIYSDGAMYTSVKNDSESGYSFSNTADANYTFTIQAENATVGQEKNSTNISMVVDDTDPTISYNSTTETDNGGANRTWIFVNVTATDTNNDTATFYLYNSTGLVYSNSSNYNSSEAITINWTGLSNDEVYYFNVTANDSATNEGLTSTRTFYLDGTNPVATLSCSPSSVVRGSTVTCTCSGTDVGGSGINSSATSAATTPSTSSTGTFTVTGCSVTDYAGNSDTSSTDTYTVTSSSSGGTTPTYEWAFQKTHAWAKITPGEATIMKDFDKEIGIKQISIEVNNEAQNVKITVTKYDGKPANVSVEKSGKVYNYLQIETENLGDKLEKGIITIRVNKSWVSDNALEKENITLFRFNNVSEEWEELLTTHTEADDDYYYYDAEVDSFSYFAIAEKVVVSDETGGEEELEEKGLGWWWVAIIAGVIIIAYLVSAKVFKKR